MTWGSAQLNRRHDGMLIDLFPSAIKMSTSHSASDTFPLTRVLSAFALFSLLMLTVLAYPGGDRVLVVMPPGTLSSDMMKTVEIADGYFIAQGSYPWLAVAQSDQPDFSRRLRAAGALAVLNQTLAVGCNSGVSK